MKSFEFGFCLLCLLGFQSKKKTMANIVDSDETAHYEPSHLDLHVYTSICFSPQG